MGEEYITIVDAVDLVMAAVNLYKKSIGSTPGQGHRGLGGSDFRSFWVQETHPAEGVRSHLLLRCEYGADPACNLATPPAS